MNRKKKEETETRTKKETEAKLRVIPLGGMREIGKNMTVFEYGDDLIVIDCGMAFPDTRMPGIDVIIPDFTYLRKNRDKFRGILITHGHEDHIGALPWLLKEFDVPVYATPMSMKLIEIKLDNTRPKVESKKLQTVRAGDTLAIGAFEIEFIHVNHSIADAVSIALTSPVGTVFFTGDFKVDYTPTTVDPIDLGKIAEIGNRGVLALISESTNAERPGHSLSEREVGKAFKEIFSEAEGRIIVATFSSNVFRLQQVISNAESAGRKVLILGRSMLNVFEAAKSLGYLTYKPATIMDIQSIDSFPPQEIVILATGSQGEPMSALSRLAYSEHHSTEIMEGDTVILSSSMIPGNEEAIYRVVNELFMKGAQVIYESLSEVHASGHACQDELKQILTLTRPRYFIPSHGEFRMLYRHAELASRMGIPNDRIALAKNGDILEFSKDGRLTFAGYTEGAGVLIDGSGMGDVDQYVLNDRLRLAEEGVVAVTIVIDAHANRLYGDPVVQAKGFIYESEMKHVVELCQERVKEIAHDLWEKKKPLGVHMTSDDVSDKIQKTLFELTRRRPVVMVAVTTV
ncbi:MAG TPA: ribonuclease J [Bacillota bacterium]|jgi:ribonuclease J|nr:ribonuclease J [Fastidiosipila sp.]HPX93131.1 ribonuclease J [Bacillota bacterium]HQB81374.1 ribonuclease J [Bacillota bacterium]